jgi:hypothetical protein
MLHRINLAAVAGTLPDDEMTAALNAVASLPATTAVPMIQ